MSKDERDVEKQERPTDSFSKRFKIIVVVALAIMCIAYFGNFHDGFGNQEQFGAFGDFFGGVLNPLLSFITILLLLESLSYQRSELGATVEELRKTAEIHEENLRHHMADEIHGKTIERYDELAVNLSKLFTVAFATYDFESQSVRKGNNAGIGSTKQPKRITLSSLIKDRDFIHKNILYTDDSDPFCESLEHFLGTALIETSKFNGIAQEYKRLGVNKILYLDRLQDISIKCNQILGGVHVLELQSELGSLYSDFDQVNFSMRLLVKELRDSQTQTKPD